MLRKKLCKNDSTFPNLWKDNYHLTIQLQIVWNHYYLFKDSQSNMKIMSQYYIDKPILLDKAFQSYWFGIEKDLMIFFQKTLSNISNIWWKLNYFWRTILRGKQLKIVMTPEFFLILQKSVLQKSMDSCYKTTRWHSFR